MRTYPIKLSLKTTRSRRPRVQQKVREFNRTAAILESHINGKIAVAPDNTFHQFMHVLLASELGLDAEVVCLALMSADGGSNGITILKGNFKLATGLSS